MSMRFKGGIISATPPTTTAYTASGAWTLQQQMQAQGSGLWPVPGGYNLFLWGANSNGQLGQSNTIYRSSPVQVGGKSWSYVAEGINFTLAVKNNGTLWAWGYGSAGNLGDGTTVSKSSPVQVGALTTWSKVAAASNVSFGIKADGTLWAWGSGYRGQTGLGNTTTYSSPVQVGSLNTWSKVIAGINSSLAIKTDGTLWAWGYNRYGNLGQGDTVPRSSPVQIGALTGWTQIGSAGDDRSSSFAIRNGTLWSWGDNANFTLGLGNSTKYSSPKQVGALTTWTKVAGGRTHTLAIRSDNALFAWGRNQNYVLGTGNATNYLSPIQISGSWMDIAPSKRKSIAIKTDGTLWAWGRNIYGQLGANKDYASVNNYSFPKQVGALTTWVSLPRSVSFSYTGLASNS